MDSAYGVVSVGDNYGVFSQEGGRISKVWG